MAGFHGRAYVDPTSVHTGDCPLGVEVPVSYSDAEAKRILYKGMWSYFSYKIVVARFGPRNAETNVK